jgi:oligoribonuclease NrnB/cAMP/cGMP phosphodiesterase (DHH superfamily)
MKNIVFTDADLDGSMCYMLLKLCATNTLPYKVTTVTKFHDDFKAWLKKNDPTQYNKIIITDLDISQQSLELVDMPNVHIIDHHSTHVENRDKYKHAKVNVVEYPSCAKLIYKLFKSKIDKHITPDQKKLLLLVDDYDSWTHQYPQSKQLNFIFWNYQGDRLEKFLKDFSIGFRGFNPPQLQTIDFYEKKLHKTLSNLTYHRATVSIGKKPTKCICTFANTLISDVGNHLVEKLDAEIGFVVNLDSNRVSIRRNKACEIHVGNLAKKLIDGGGHESAAGGVCTETFLKFSKVFTPSKN